MTRPKTLVISALVLLLPCAVTAHEFWIDPPSFQLSPDAPVVADLRVGEAFKGGSQPYLSQSTRRFDLVIGDRMIAVEPRIGDRPALNVTLDGDGLVIAVHVTEDSVLTYNEFAKFQAFVMHKGAGWAVDEHQSRGLPDDGFREAYSRYAKSLVAIGDGAGSDREIGLETEIVALENPYTGDMSDGIDVALLYQGKPRKDAQIEVFSRDGDDSVTVSLVQTDERGRATIPVVPGNRYMLDAVVLRVPSPELADTRGAVWESLWANMTFFVPR